MDVRARSLASMLTIERVQADQGERYQVAIYTGACAPSCKSWLPIWLANPQNARFIFNDDTDQLEVIEPAVIGRDAERGRPASRPSTQKIAAGRAQHRRWHSTTLSRPSPNDATGESLGITELVSAHTSYFYGSSSRSHPEHHRPPPPRFHGLLVPPGATFSMADALGDVSLDNGYAEALIIFGDRTIKGVGGGVCQVSTTLFRTAFFAGYPIVERYPHAYRVGYYEQTPAAGTMPDLAGLDATVFVPVVDFKFTNDTPYWLLMETYVNAEAPPLTWKFYSTSDGRTVEWDTTGTAECRRAARPGL